MRALLVAVLINGLVPTLGEVAEAMVHYAVEGHLAHSESDQGDLGEQGQEHGCGPTEHHCTCCPSQTLVPATRTAALPEVPSAARAHALPGSLASLQEPEPPVRPPITS
jgi:hypothetical protein